ncbi:AfsR/SARP family transcriptional regulator [Streptomyces inhibens]|uniref:AfsR/SARP family transcriptional regulator n=1 Tax=Streptomyces inhibens TaxID=2293571 RepID=UPI0024786FFB|nr:AfsR/SARP family transcriptional regulator [Streptomyces inhibens]UKY51798.1 AfsR/SARP family transcriptional regulator [Streptomyces inhibens]
MQVVNNGEFCTPTAPKVRRTLALLLFRANQIVDMEALIDELWDDHPPRSAVTTSQTYIYQLRKAFGRSFGDEEASRILATRPPGYGLYVSDDQLDANMFERLADEGRELHERGRLEDASRRLHEALSLWRGRVLADVSAGKILEAHVVRLEEMRIRTTQLHVQTRLQLGRHLELVPELRALVADHPLNEWFHAQLITVLRHTGRRGEALNAYQSLRKVLHDELGIEPTIPLQRLQRSLLSRDEGHWPGPIPVQPVTVTGSSVAS